MRLLFLIGFMAIANVVCADVGPYGYVITKQAVIRDEQGRIIERPKPVIESTNWGTTWDGFIGHLQSMPMRDTHELIFEFETPNYFAANNVGHFAVGVRSDYSHNAPMPPNLIEDDLRGRGVIIGNVTAYGNNGSCGPTQHPKAIAMEIFYTGFGNCVYGPTTESPPLENNVRYRVQITSFVERWAPFEAERYVHRYRLWKKVGSSWTLMTTKQFLEQNSPQLDPPKNMAGFFFYEVFSEHAWTFYLYNVTSKTCLARKTSCTVL